MGRNQGARPKPSDDEKQAIHHVLYFYDAPGGYEPGSFTQHLMIAYSQADPQNKAKLRLGFPEIAWAMDMVSQVPDGIKVITERLEA